MPEVPARRDPRVPTPSDFRLETAVKIVRDLVRRKWRTRHDCSRDDAEQHCLLRLLEAYPGYDHRKSAWSTFVWMISSRALADLFRAYCRRDSLVDKMRIAAPERFVATRDEDDPASEVRDQSAVEVALRRLTPMQRTYVAMRYGLLGEKPHSFREMQRRLGRGQGAIQSGLERGTLRLMQVLSRRANPLRKSEDYLVQQYMTRLREYRARELIELRAKQADGELPDLPAFATADVHGDLKGVLLED